MRINRSVAWTIPAAIMMLWAAGPALGAAERPNVVLIMTDNHGAWTLGCYGNPDIRTPHIDRLARQGIRFSRAFSSNPVCSPTRATFLTGLMPSQHGVHSYLRGGNLQIGDDARNTLEGFRSLPEILSDAGYVCGLSGKWHLGDNLRPQEGFSSWITMPHGHTSRFYGARVIEDGEIRKHSGYLTELWTDHAVQFIERNKSDDRPFFLFLSYNGPYGLGGSLLKPARNRHLPYYTAEDFESFPRAEQHPWLHNNKRYLNNEKAMRRYACELSGVDDGVGRVMATLKRHGLDKNTLVIFCADQGWVGGQNGIWGMGDHTRPLSAFDGMMRIPLIFRHPGEILAGRTSDLMTSNYDLMPTVLSYLGLGERMPAEPESPGRDFSAVLRGEAVEDWDNVVFYETENVRTIRTERWKYVHRHPDGPHELYDLKNDPDEKFNLYGQPGHETKRRELRRRLEAFFDEYAEPEYDLYEGGGSQTHLLMNR